MTDKAKSPDALRSNVAAVFITGNDVPTTPALFHNRFEGSTRSSTANGVVVPQIPMIEPPLSPKGFHRSERVEKSSRSVHLGCHRLDWSFATPALACRAGSAEPTPQRTRTLKPDSSFRYVPRIPKSRVGDARDPTQIIGIPNLDPLLMGGVPERQEGLNWVSIDNDRTEGDGMVSRVIEYTTYGGQTRHLLGRTTHS